MRVFNVRLAAILLAIGVVFVVGVYFLHGFQVQREAGYFLEVANTSEKEAERAAKDKDSASEAQSTKDAIKYLEWYIRLKPQDVGAMERLGVMLDENSRDGDVVKNWPMFRKGLDCLEKTVRLAPKQATARRRLVKMTILRHGYQDAKEHLAILLADSPNDPELLAELGECQARMGKYKEACETFQKAIAHDKDKTQLDAYEQLAGLLRFRMSQPEAADKWMEKLVKANPTSYKAHWLRSRYLSDASVNRQNEALEEASKALKLAPDDVEVLWQATMCDAVAKHFDEARGCAARGIKLYPNNAHLYLILSTIEEYTGSRDKAIAVLRQGVKPTDRNPDILWQLANLLVDANKLEESQKLLDELQATPYPKLRIALTVARIDFAKQHWSAALKGFESSRGAFVTNLQTLKRIDNWTAECYRCLGNPEKQEEALRRALNIDPTFAPAKAALTDVMMKKGTVEDVGFAAQQLEEMALHNQLSPRGWIQLANVRFQQTNRQDPANRDWTRVEKVLDVAEKLLPDAPEIAVLRAEILAARNHVDDAEKLLLKARDKNSKQAIIWGSLIGLAIHEQQWDKAENLLKQSEKALGDCVEQRLIQAQYLVQHKGNEAKATLRKLVENSDQFSESDRVRLWGGLLNAALLTGDSQQADLLNRKIAETRPNDVQVRTLAFERALAANDQAAMERALADIEQVAGQTAYWLYGQAVLLYMRANNSQDAPSMLKQALAYLRRAREQRKDWSRISLAEALIYDAQHKPDLALQKFQEAIGEGDRSPSALVRAVRLLYQTQQYAEADRLLRQLEKEQKTLSPELTRAAAEVALQQGDNARALEKARQAVSADSKDYKENLWLGQVLGSLGSQAKSRGQGDGGKELLGDAEKSLRRAAELEPKLPAVWVSLVRFYTTIHEKDKADAAIHDAIGNLPAKGAHMALAQCYEAAKETDQAQKEYEAALEAAPKDVAVLRAVAEFYERSGKSQPAEALLQKILDGKVPAKDPEMMAARRQLAWVYAVRGGYNNLQKAQELNAQNLASSGASVEDVELNAELKAADPRQGQRSKAMDLLRKMVENKTASPEDRLALARMYEAVGNWTKASNLLQDLVAENEKDPRYLTIYIEALLQHNELSSAEMYLGRLEELAPNSFTTVGLRADLLRATNQPLQAFDLLKGFLDKPDALPKDRGQRIRLVADRVDHLGLQLKKPDEASLAGQCAAYAESLYRTYNQETPGRELVLAVFLGTRNKVDEALDILEKSSKAIPPGDLAEACSLIIQHGKADAKHLDRMNEILLSATKQGEPPIILMLVQADLRIHQDRFADAIDIFRKVLGKEPNNFVALNNLAVLQALQGANLDESLKMVNQAIDIAGPLGAMLDSRATVYMAMKNSGKALEDMQAAVADQETPVRLFHLAQAYDLGGDQRTARKVMDTALQKGLDKDALHPLEVPSFERLRKLPR